MDKFSVQKDVRRTSDQTARPLDKTDNTPGS